MLLISLSLIKKKTRSVHPTNKKFSWVSKDGVIVKSTLAYLLLQENSE